MSKLFASFNRLLTRSAALAASVSEPNVVYFPTDATCIIMNGKEYGDPQAQYNPFGPLSVTVYAYAASEYNIGIRSMRFNNHVYLAFGGPTDIDGIAEVPREFYDPDTDSLYPGLDATDPKYGQYVLVVMLSSTGGNGRRAIHLSKRPIDLGAGTILSVRNLSTQGWPIAIHGIACTKNAYSDWDSIPADEKTLFNQTI